MTSVRVFSIIKNHCAIKVCIIFCILFLRVSKLLRTRGGFILIKDYFFFFYSENSQSVEQPSQGHGRVPTTGDFQDAAGQGARMDDRVLPSCGI